MDNEQELKEIDPIDQLPMEIVYDEQEIISLAINNKTLIDTARSWWFDRKLTFLHQWDDFVQYDKPRIIESQPYIHIPMTFGKIMTWHARMYNAIFSQDPIFHIEPLNSCVRDEVDATKMVLQWYLRDEINYQKGLKGVFDEMLWELGADGWAIIYKEWVNQKRMIHTLNRAYKNGSSDPRELMDNIKEAASQIRAVGRPKKSLNDYPLIKEVLTVFNGVNLKTIPQENVYFPDYIPESGDMNYPKIVMLEEVMHEEDVIYNKAKKLWYPDACDFILDAGKGYDDGRKMEIRQLRSRLQQIDMQQQVLRNEYQVYHMFLREDLDDDGIPEEYVFTMSLRARKVLAVRYLEQISNDFKRPVYKFDLFKVPRLAYSKGLVEILYSLNCEVDDFHNVRRVSGLIANVPWGFYRASSGMDKEAIEVRPGKFFPVDDPANDVKPMQFPNVTTWALQEEQLAQTYGDQLTSMPPMLQGQMPQTIGPMRSTSGMLSTIQESSAPLSVQLDRLRIPCGMMFNGILADLQVRLPKVIIMKVLGDGGELLWNADGSMLTLPISRDLIGGKYKFSLAANDALYNPEQDKQEAQQIAQMMLSQIPLQMGLVTPTNAYYIYRNMLDKFGYKEISKYLTQPQLIPQPVNLFQEYTMICDGDMPPIVQNDDHEGKIKGLLMLAASPEYQQGKMMNPPTVSPLADLVMDKAILVHKKMLAMVQSAQANVQASGTQNMGANMANMGQNQAHQPQQPNQGQPANAVRMNAAKGGSNGGRNQGSTGVPGRTSGMGGLQGAGPSD